MLSALGYGAFVVGGLIVASCSKHPDNAACSPTVKRGLAILGACFCGIGATGLWVFIFYQK